MEISSITIVCPDCGKPATVTMLAVNGQHPTLEFDCRNGHKVPGPNVEQIWVAAHQ